jgi:hypothetical protein
VGRGWQATVRVERTKTTTAPADRAWSLLSSPQAWSARPHPSTAFDLDWPASAAGESGPMWFCLAGADGALAAAVFEASVVVPGSCCTSDRHGVRRRGAISDEQQQGFEAAVARNADRFKAAIESWRG